MLQPSTLKFLHSLKKNNNKPWFDAHRQQYEDAKNDFGSFVQSIIDKHGRKDESIAHLRAKDTTFRINRDVRFSKDKSPYKHYMGSYMARGGKKSVFGGYYFQCQPGRCFVGGGLWMPMPAELSKVRQEIDYNFDEFKKIIKAKKFKTVYGDLSKEAEYTLTRVPKGYDADNPAADYIKLKSFVSIHFLKESDMVSKDLTKKILAACEALQPMLMFLNRSLE